MKPFRIMNEVNAESPSTWYSKHMPRISKLYPCSLQSDWTSPKCGKIIPYAIFAQKRALPCTTKIILTEKLVGIRSSNFGFFHLDNWATSKMSTWLWVRGAVRACGSVLDRKLLERLMSPSPKSQVMFASAFSWIGDLFFSLEFLGLIFFKLWRVCWI